MTDLNQRVALVTGASRGVGRGVALGLAHAGATVFATGRSIGHADLGAGIITIACDHTDDEAVAGVFRRIDNEAGRLDILVNVAWGGYERMVEEGRFTWAAPFWEQPAWRWDAMVTAGVRAAFVASQHAARRMIPVNRGLIVHVSSWAAQKYGGNVVYGLAKAATDRMASDMAHQLQPHGVTVVSLVSRAGPHRGRARRRRVRSQQFGKSGIHRPRGRRAGGRFRRLTLERIGRRRGGVGGGVRLHGHRWPAAARVDLGRRVAVGCAAGSAFSSL